MKLLRIGDIVEQTGYAAETIRRFEKAGRIPGARRGRGGWRYWYRRDLPAILRALNAEAGKPPTLAESFSNVLDSVTSSSTLGGLLDVLPPDVKRVVKELVGDEAFEQATHALVRS